MHLHFSGPFFNIDDLTFIVFFQLLHLHLVILFHLIESFYLLQRSSELAFYLLSKDPFFPDSFFIIIVGGGISIDFLTAEKLTIVCLDLYEFLFSLNFSNSLSICKLIYPCLIVLLVKLTLLLQLLNYRVLSVELQLVVLDLIHFFLKLPAKPLDFTDLFSKLLLHLIHLLFSKGNREGSRSFFQ